MLSIQLYIPIVLQLFFFFRNSSTSTNTTVVLPGITPDTASMWRIVTTRGPNPTTWCDDERHQIDKQHGINWCADAPHRFGMNELAMEGD